MSPPKPRNKENRGLPKRWSARHGAYYYQVPIGLESHWDGKKLFRLGKTLPEAYRTWADRIEVAGSEIETMEALCDRYAQQHIPTLAPKTQESYIPSNARIRTVFGKMPVSAFEPHQVRKYFEKVTSTRSLSVARSDITVLRGLFAKAMDWGVIKAHPMTGMKFKQLKAATDEVQDWEIDALLSFEATSRSAQVGQLYTRLKIMLGCRRGDLLRIKLSDLKDDGIHVTPSKTKESSQVRQIFRWTDDEGNEISELRNVIDAILAVPPSRIGDAHLFTTREGKGFMNESTGRSNSFDSLWGRYMDAAQKHTDIDHKIKEKTFRAYVGSESISVEDAAERLGHTNTATTQKHYRSKPRIITPLLRKDRKQSAD